MNFNRLSKYLHNKRNIYVICGNERKKEMCVVYKETGATVNSIIRCRIKNNVLKITSYDNPDYSYTFPENMMDKDIARFVENMILMYRNGQIR